MDVRLPDGTVIAGVPDGTTKADLVAKLARNGYDVSGLGGEPTPRDIPAPTPIDISSNIGKATREEMASRPWIENQIAAVGNAVRGPYEGVKQLLGMGDKQNAEAVRTIDQEAPTGAIAGNLAMMAVPGVGAATNTLGRSAALGAGLGALQPTLEGESRLANAAIGGASGAVGYGVGKAAGRVLAPQTREAARLLRDEGVRLTPGQVLGGAAQRIEDASTSIPFAGDVIRGAKVRATEDFNRAAYNRVLAPLGEAVDRNFPVGREGVEEVSRRVSDAYHQLLPQLHVQGDPQFGQRLLNLRQMATSLPPAQSAQLDRIMQNELLSRFTPAGLMSGETMKQVDSKLGSIAANYRGAPDPDQRALGGAVRQLQGELRSLVARNNPAEAPRLTAINEAYANLLRVESAAGTLGAQDGVFSGAQLTNRVRAKDASLNKRAFAQGKALMQDLAESGKDVLGQKVPDSGTPFRLANMLGAGGAAFLDPSVTATVAALGGAYTRPGQAVLRGLLMDRPQVVRSAGRYLPIAGTASGVTAPWIVE